MMCVILVIESHLIKAQRKFIARRFTWLLNMKEPQNSTVLVEGIPDDCCTDTKLKAKFDSLFPGKVQSATMVKKTAELAFLVADMRAAETAQHEAEHAKATGAATNPLTRVGMSPKDPVEYYKGVVAEAKKMAYAEQ